MTGIGAGVGIGDGLGIGVGEAGVGIGVGIGVGEGAVGGGDVGGDGAGVEVEVPEFDVAPPQSDNATMAAEMTTVVKKRYTRLFLRSAHMLHPRGASITCEEARLHGRMVSLQSHVGLGSTFFASCRK
ncbi:MAG TPA: hypothetical protein VKW78_21750 [Terriglobales bacterium]|nr:hypothetical protein [Terriglobales bacterium]